MDTYYLADTPTIEESVDALERTTRPNAVLQAVRTGEFRTPKAGEWFLSGAIPAAYRATNDLSGEYSILRLVAVYRVVSYEVEDREIYDKIVQGRFPAVSMGCRCDGDEPCKICSGEEKNPVVIAIPFRPSGEPNANGDIFPDGLQIPEGTKVRHEDKVFGEVSAAVPIDVPPSPANDPSPLKEMFTLTHIPVTDPRRLVPMVTALLERFDAVPEKMIPNLSAHGAWDLDNYWEPLVAQMEVLRGAMKELRVITLPTDIGGFTTLPPCSHCSGSGQDPMYLCQGITPPLDGGHRCPRCGGSGKEKGGSQ